MKLFILNEVEGYCGKDTSTLCVHTHDHKFSDSFPMLCYRNPLFTLPLVVKTTKLWAIVKTILQPESAIPLQL